MKPLLRRFLRPPSTWQRLGSGARLVGRGARRVWNHPGTDALWAGMSAYGLANELHSHLRGQKVNPMYPALDALVLSSSGGRALTAFKQWRALRKAPRLARMRFYASPR